MLRTLVIFIVLVLLGMQYQYWFGDSGYFATLRLASEVKAYGEYNRKLIKRNASLRKQIVAVSEELGPIEAIARTELGMVRKGEMFYLIVDSILDE